MPDEIVAVIPDLSPHHSISASVVVPQSDEVACRQRTWIARHHGLSTSKAAIVAELAFAVAPTWIARGA